MREADGGIVLGVRNTYCRTSSLIRPRAASERGHVACRSVSAAEIAEQSVDIPQPARLWREAKIPESDVLQRIIY